MTNQEAVNHLDKLKMDLVEQMAKFAAKRSVSHEEKCANATARRLEMKAIEMAIYLLINN